MKCSGPTCCMSEVWWTYELFRMRNSYQISSLQFGKLIKQNSGQNFLSCRYWAAESGLYHATKCTFTWDTVYDATWSWVSELNTGLVKRFKHISVCKYGDYLDEANWWWKWDFSVLDLREEICSFVQAIDIERADLCIPLKEGETQPILLSCQESDALYCDLGADKAGLRHALGFVEQGFPSQIYCEPYKASHLTHLGIVSVISKLEVTTSISEVNFCVNSRDCPESQSFCDYHYALPRCVSYFASSSVQ